MSCCTGPAGIAASTAEQVAAGKGDFSLAQRDLGEGVAHLDLLVPDMHCAGCIARIEDALSREPAVTGARVNMSSRRVAVSWRQAEAAAEDIAGIIGRLGYTVQPFDTEDSGGDAEWHYGRDLLLSLAVAGFAAGNIMLLSVSVWSGAEGATRDLFHWISALIALPAITIAGRPFFRSAWAALKGGSVNMDVPISLAVLLAAGLSLYETWTKGAEVYFDAAVTLLFFLLIGRYLDHLMRDRARSAVTHLLSMTPRAATVIGEDGERNRRPVSDIVPGIRVAVAAGESIPVDGVIARGTSEIDVAMVTGEATPEARQTGDVVYAGTINLTAPLEVTATKAPEESFLAEVIAMMETAEQGKSAYVRLADKAARIYVPVVHLLALVTLLGWLWVSGGDWHIALFTAIAVLIITCPCALGLAVPVVQVVANGVLFGRGIMVKDGAALEKLSEADAFVLDKTGTVTLGRPHLAAPTAVDVDRLALAAGLARHSRHPLSQAIVDLAVARGVAAEDVIEVSEHPGRGLEGIWRGRTVRLGRRSWCGADAGADAGAAAVQAIEGAGPPGQLEICLADGLRPPLVMQFADEIRPDAEAAIDALMRSGARVVMLSGDRPEAVEHVAAQVGITTYAGGMTPEDKVGYVNRLAGEGHKVAMVGDGINDAPALASGHTSLAPAGAADVGRAAADFVFLGDSLYAVVRARETARRARRLVRQNFGLAVLYNMIAVPIAVMGLASPLVAAIAMSSSSIVVTANALRLRLMPISRGNAAQLSEAGGQPVASDGRVHAQGVNAA